MRTLSFLTFWFFAIALIAQNNIGHSLVLTPNWTPGEQLEYRITKIRKVNTKRQVSEDSTQYGVIFELVEKTADRYQIRWQFDRSQMEMSQFLPLVNDLISKNIGVDEIHYEVDTSGVFLGIVNWEKLRDTLVLMHQDLKATLEQSKVFYDSETLRQALAPMLEAIATREGIETILFQELPCFHAPFGLELEIDNAIDYTIEVPNVLTGDLIEVEGVISLHSWDQESGSCEIRDKVITGDDQMKPHLRTVLQRFGDLSESELNQLLSKSEYKMEEWTSYQFDTDVGLPRYIQYEKQVTFKMAGQQSVQGEILRIERL